MPDPSAEILTFTIITSTFLLLVFGIIIVRYIFLYQKKRYKHQKEVLELREGFTQTLLQSKIEIQEQTLNHISKELHANFSQLVSLININLSELLPNSPEEIKDNILETKALSKQLLSDLKSLSVSLNTEHIRNIGLLKALENELARLRKAKKYDIEFLKNGAEYRIRPDREIIVFRLCQEALNNTLKYAKATAIHIRFDFEERFLTLEIIDNGMGFDVESVILQSGENQSTGILNMQKRAKLIEGILQINSTIGEGTCVKITIPR